MALVDRRLIVSINWALLGLTLLLFGLGVLNLYSASGFRMEDGLTVSSFYKKQLVWGGMGLLSLLAVLLFDYKRLASIAWPAYAVAVLLLLAVPLVGKTVYGAKRWIDFGPISLQPSEVAKLAMLLLAARLLSSEQGVLGWSRLGMIMGITLVPAGLIIIQPDLGSGLLVLALVGGMVLYQGLKKQIFIAAALVIPPLLPFAWTHLKPYQQRRILTFINPSNDPLGSGYHIIQSQIAIGSGQLWGKGFLGGTQSQLRFLPEKHTDFALAVFGEEWGFAGCLLLLALFCLFLNQLHVTARDSKDRFGSFICAGVFFYFFWQILINMGMVLGLMPVVGVPLPFISYGGSATLVNFALIGLVINVSMRRFLFKA